ncbi:MAG: type IV secretion system protein VirD4, partial [Pelagibacterales bacterium]|nr:type IV secretion system protein VirD4 [Pelagibacterales bacterium]
KPKYLDLNPGSRSLHVSHTQRALLLPQEVIQLPREDQIVLIESQPPIRCKKIIYFKDKFFTSKLWKKTKIPQQKPYMPDYSKNKASKDENSNQSSEVSDNSGTIEG